MSFYGVVPDRRLARRLEHLMLALTTLRCVSIARLATTWAEQIAFYRLLSNQRLLVSQLAEGLFAWMKRPRSSPAAPFGQEEPTREEGPHLLLIEDSTEISFGAHRGRIRDKTGLGWLSNNRRYGYCLHATLALEARSQNALGLADLKIWSRPEEATGSERAKSYRDLPIEEKESFRWIEALQHAAARLRAHFGSATLRLTMVADREADLYTLFARRGACDLIVRSSRDRRITQAPGHLYALLHAQPIGGYEAVRLRGDVRRNLVGRIARLGYRYARVEVLRPERAAKPDADGVRDARTLWLWAVLVEEVDAPEASPPICWCLLTTHPVESLAQARQVCAYYRARWWIEQTFRLLKQDGLALEESEIERGEALQRLGVLAVGAAFDVLRLLLAERAGEVDVPVEQVFTPAEQQCLEALAEQVEGKSEKLKNPHAGGTLAWASWIIARLGGWKGYASQHRAGPATYHYGLERFHQISQGWALALQDAYKP